MTWTSHRREALADAMRIAAESVTIDELAAVAEPIRRAAAASHVLFYRYGDDGRLRGVGGDLVDALPRYAQELLEDDPVQRYMHRLRAGARVVTACGVDAAAYRSSAAYGDFYRPHDVEHLIGLWITALPYGAPGMTGILCTRSRTEPTFSRGDAGQIARAIPALAAAARRAARVERAAREHAAMSVVLSELVPWPCIACDLTGRLVWVSPRAEALFCPELGRSGALPSPLAEAVARFGAAVLEPVASAPPRFTLVFDLAGAPIRAELHLARTSSGEPIVAAMLEPLAPGPAAIALVRERYALTNAETSVLAGIAEGLSNPAIARRLFVSVETVKTHAQRILAKLGVDSRTKAALLVRSIG